MKIILLFGIWCLLSIGACDAQCNSSLWKHVYHPERFIKYGCRTVTGVVALIRPHEKDGDFHVCLKLDKGQPRYLNQKNMDHQRGCLVLEIICISPVTQQDAIRPCKKCPQPVKCPKKGDHIKVTGTFVTDTDGGHGWNEIHPVSTIEKL
jgi:hypothetical protein